MELFFMKKLLLIYFLPTKFNRKFIKIALKNQRVKQEYEVIKKRINEGVNPIDLGKKSTNLFDNKVLIKVEYSCYIVQVSSDQVNVLGISARRNYNNMKTFQKSMNEM